eukprot:SM000002S05649  [mRNA]  locus=s2:1374426:1379090:- [translate_table: standard]
MTTLSALLTSVSTSFVLFLGILLVYVLLSKRRANFPVYYPARLLSGQGPPEHVEKKGLFSWLAEARSVTEEEIIAFAGVDAAVYLRLLLTCLHITIFAAVYCCLVLIPLCAQGGYYESHNEHQVEPGQKFRYDSLDLLAMGNIQDGSPLLWAFAIGAYWVTMGTFLFLRRAFMDISKLRWRHQATERARPDQYTVLVRDIPPPRGIESQQEHVEAFMKDMHPGTFERAIIIQKMDKVQKTWMDIEKTRRQLEQARAMLAKGDMRPHHRLGLFGVCGKEVDSIDYYSEHLMQLEKQVEREQRLTREESEPVAALAIFNSRPAAAIASQIVHAQHAETWITSPAPEPREVIWENLTIPLTERIARQIIANFIVFLTVCFYMIPITFATSLTTIDNFRKIFPFAKRLINMPVLKNALEAYLPPLILATALTFIPVFMTYLSRFEGYPQESTVTRATMEKYFYFIIFNVFIGGTVSGSIFQTIQLVVKEPMQVLSILGASLPPNANFFITFVALKLFVGYGIELLRPVPFIQYYAQRAFFCKTQKDVNDSWQPGPTTYGAHVPFDLLIMTLGLCYAVIAPIILPFTALYFAFGWLTMRHQAMNVYVPSFEGGGRMWRHISSRILAVLFTAQITMLGYFGIKRFSATVVLVPLPLATAAFYAYCNQCFYPSFYFTSLETARQQPAPVAYESSDKKGYQKLKSTREDMLDGVVREVPTLEEIVHAYTPECMAEPGQKEEFRQDTTGSDSLSETSKLLLGASVAASLHV